jgi:hypothetical protein
MRRSHFLLFLGKKQQKCHAAHPLFGIFGKNHKTSKLSY